LAAAMRSAATAKSASWWVDMAYPSMRRLNRSRTVAR
jgi:hypothetical protein